MKVQGGSEGKVGDGSEKPRRIVKFCGVNGCCPQVEFLDGGKIEISDDFGGKVALTAAQWEGLKAVQEPKAG